MRSSTDVKPAPQELQDKHYYRKHGANAYYGHQEIRGNRYGKVFFDSNDNTPDL